MIRAHAGRIIVALTLAVSAFWITRRTTVWEQGSRGPADDDSFEPATTLSLPALPPLDHAEWRPEAHVAGSGDLFTPPPLVLDPAGRRFVRAAAEAAPAVEEPAVTLVGLVRPAFRLQLVGFTGGPGQESGLFENGSTGEVFLAAGGHDLPELGLRIESLEVQRHAVAEGNQTPLAQTVAIANVLDFRTGERLRISTLERQVAGPWRAQLRLTGQDEVIEISAGAEVAVGEGKYRVGSIAPERGAVELIAQRQAEESPTSLWVRISE